MAAQLSEADIYARLLHCSRDLALKAQEHMDSLRRHRTDLRGQIEDSLTGIEESRRLLAAWRT